MGVHVAQPKSLEAINHKKLGSNSVALNGFKEEPKSVPPRTVA